MSDEKTNDEEIRELPPVALTPGYNPAADPTVKALSEVPATDEALRMEIERAAIEQSENGPKDTDRAASPAQDSKDLDDTGDLPVGADEDDEPA